MPEGRVALVTGASSGIGEACARTLARHGFLVYGTSRRTDFAPADFEGLVMDVTSAESVERAVSRLLAQTGRLDVAVNNAGWALAGAVEETPIEPAREQFETNFFGVLRVLRAVLPPMRAAGAGLVVNVSSIGGLMGLPFQGLYSASKFALEGLTESLRQEVARFGIRVVLIEPGDVRTAIGTRRRRIGMGPGSAYRGAGERTLAVVEREEDGGASPQEVAELLLRLTLTARPRARYTVGHPTQRLAAWLKRALPGRLFESVLMSHYRLNRRRERADAVPDPAEAGPIGTPR
jgi:NAD(P)-dependent dehydrogenase (short-subunit alcohol dehydrogenase family)